MFWFDLEYGPEGVPVLKPPDPGRPPTPRELHVRRMYLLGITSREDVEREWRRAEELRRKVEAAAGGKKKRDRRRKGERRAAD